MNLEVIGRHALFFDDDAMAAFVNSADALVEWHSLPIDRYDVRHLLSDPPPPRNRRKPTSSPTPLYSSAEPPEPDIDYERYLDLPASDDEPGNDDERLDAGRYNTVGFSYGVQDASTVSTDVSSYIEGSGFRPSFVVPDHLLDRLARSSRGAINVYPSSSDVMTKGPCSLQQKSCIRSSQGQLYLLAKMVDKSEIVLRVKQGDNPTFGFLMPDHHLHAYFRYLVDHQELLVSDLGAKNLEVERKAKNEHTQAVEVSKSGLSLLGSIYGSGEDEDGAVEDETKPEDCDSGKVLDDPEKVGHSDQSAKLHEKDKTSPSPLVPTFKENPVVSKKNRPANTIKARTNGNLNKDAEDEASTVTVMSLSSNQPKVLMVDSLILEPPSDLKKMVEKIVEFILQKGKEFEAVVVEQDAKYGRFPFLLPSNPYHPYYLKTLEKAQELKISGKALISEKDDTMRRALDKINKKLALSTKEIEAMSLESASGDIPFESDKKEKFKMVITKPKKDAAEPPSKPPEPYSGFKVDATAAAAILQAVRRGEKYPNLEITSKNDKNQQAGSSHNKPDKQVESVGNANVESEITKEQKLKADRLKRAKLFASMIKNGGTPKPEILRGLSAERPDTVPHISGIENFLSKQRERSSTPLDAEAEDNKNRIYFEDEDENKERRSRRSYRPRSKIDDDEDSDPQCFKKTSRSKSKLEDDEDTDDHDQHRSRKSLGSRSKIDNDDDIDEDSDRYDRRQSKRSKRSRSKLHDDGDSLDEKDGHDEHRSKRSYQSRSKLHDDDGSLDEKDGHDEHRSKRSHRSRSKLEDDDVLADDYHQRLSKKHGRSRPKLDNNDVSSDDYHHHQSKKSRSRSKIDNGGEDDDYEVNDSSDRDEKPSKKRLHSRRSSHHSKERRHNKHRKRHSSSKHRDDDSTSDDEHRHSKKPSKRFKSEREADLEEGEIATKKVNRSEAACTDHLSISNQGVRASSQQPATSATEVPDELRAKIRAMLMANM